MKNELKQKQAEIINIGDELLAGHTVNSNATWMSRELRKIGIRVTKHLVIADERDAIIGALDQVGGDIDYVFITGGLGPTEDDRTKAVITSYFGGNLVFSDEIYHDVEAFFARRGRIPSESNKTQAVFPDNAERIINTMGTASGMIFGKAGTTYFVMPGVPYEMQSMMTLTILPGIAGDGNVLTREYQIHTFGLPESDISDTIDKHLPHIRRDMSVGFYPSIRGITIRLNGQNEKAMEHARNRIAVLLGNAVYSFDGDDMAEIVWHLCVERQLTLSVAESCTGGLTASMITDIPGSSKIFKQGFVVYSNEAKIRELGVEADIIAQHGAVSSETVEAMARGLKDKTGADIAIGISGIAGPDGATPDKPVGLVYIAVLYRGKLRIKKVNFDRGRLKNKNYAARAALNEVRLAILETE
jgi:nicotinamide-nucleotide amidase